MIFNNYDFGKDIIVESIDRRVLPMIFNNTKYIVGKTGVRHINSNLGTNIIVVRCRIIKSNRTEVQETVREIAGKLYTEEPAVLCFKEELDLHYYATIDTDTEINKFLYTGYTELTFICHDPLAYKKEKIVNINEEFENMGTYKTSKGVINITPQPGNDLVIKVNGSEKLKLIYPFSGTESIRIDLDSQNITMNGNQAMKYLSYESDFFLIGQGVNKIDANATGTITFKEAFL